MFYPHTDSHDEDALMRRQLLLILLALGLQGCVTEPARIANTPSGAPEVVIKSRSAREIHDVFMAVFAEEGWQVVTDYGSSITARHEMDATKAAGRSFASAVISGQKGGQYQEELVIALVPDANGTRVIVRIYNIVQWPGGQIERTQEQSNVTFNSTQEVLNGIRKNVDGY